MKKVVSALALSAACIAAPSYAQSEGAAEAAEHAIEAAVEAAEAATTKGAARYRGPRLRNYQFIKPADYPVAAWQSNEMGVVRYSVDVSAEGKPLGCTIIEDEELTRLPVLEPATCKLLIERAEFRPAKNKDKEDVAGTYEGRHNWRKREPELPQMSLIYQYTHGADGVSSDCEFLKKENLPKRMREDIERDEARGKLCSGPASNRGIPYRDENGVPIAKRVTVTMNVVLEEPAPEASQ
ncbi:MAG: hypothetical protein ABJ242_10715 [Marinomonas sp.]